MTIDEMLLSGGQTFTNSVNSLAIGIGSRKEQERQYNYTKDLAEIQHEYNTDAMRLQQGLNMQSWQEQFDAINAYNHPSQVIQRNLEANLNPLWNEANSSSQASPSSSSVGLGQTSIPNFQPSTTISDVVSAQVAISDLTLRQQKIDYETNLMQEQANQLLSQQQLTDEQAKQAHEMTQNIVADTMSKFQSMEMQIKQYMHDTELAWAMYELQRRNTVVGETNSAIASYEALTDAEFKQGSLAATNQSNLLNAEGLQIKRDELNAIIVQNQKVNQQRDLEIRALFEKQEWEQISSIIDKASVKIFGNQPIYYLNELMSVINICSQELGDKYATRYASAHANGIAPETDKQLLQLSKELKRAQSIIQGFMHNNPIDKDTNMPKYLLFPYRQ